MIIFKNIFKLIYGIAIDFLFPAKCAVCEKYIEERSEILCSECSKKILLVSKSRENHESLKEVWRLTKYHEGTRELIRELKFNNKIQTLTAIKMILEVALATSDELKSVLKVIDIATAVPLYSTRERERGFNQVDLIFEEWLRKQNISVEKLLLRIKETKHLYDMSPTKRKTELEGAFAISENVEEKIQGKKILIVDDIFTTGTTMSKCAEVLKLSGATEVYGLALASDFKYQ